MSTNPDPGAVSTIALGEQASLLRQDADAVLCVDLDGTLVRTDTLLELLFAVARRAPWQLLFLPFWVLRGKAFLKCRLTGIVTLRVESLPYRQDLLELLQAEAKAGRRLVLASGADETIARRVAVHLGLFEHVIASDGQRNMVGAAKTNAIRAVLGAQEFIYAGNSRDDFAVWSSACGAILAGAPRSFEGVLRKRGQNVLLVLGGGRSKWRSLVKAIRPHQWSKNSLIFVALILSHKLFDPALVLQALKGFFAFSFAASTLYIVNDLLDLEADRNHPRKRSRPFAAGDLSLAAGVLLAMSLAVASALVSLQLPVEARLLLAGYCATSLIYSLALKQYLFIDVVVLAGFFTLRLLFGGAATGINISIWTLAFSMFLFLSLALVKRMTELRIALTAEKSQLHGRGYVAADLPIISSLSAASGLLSVLVLAFYLQSNEIRALYRHPSFLWFICPLLIYWLGRFAILANRGYIHDDPIVFAFTDRASLITGALAVAVLALAL